MRRLIPYALLAVLIIAAGLFTILSYSQATAKSSATIVLSCSRTYGQKPSSYVIACADYNSKFTGLHWTDWGDPTAYATGVARWNDCTPNCADGKWKSAPATLWAWDLRDGHYTKLASSDPSILPTVVLKPYPA